MTRRRPAVHWVGCVTVAFVLAGPLIGASPAPARVDTASKCESLVSVVLPGGTVGAAQAVAAGTFTLSGGPGARSSLPPQQLDALKSLPAFCRVQATLTPSSDSDIKIEVWLPAAGWNGKFEAVGNGGWSERRRAREPDPVSV